MFLVLGRCISPMNNITPKGRIYDQLKYITYPSDIENLAVLEIRVLFVCVGGKHKFLEAFKIAVTLHPCQSNNFFFIFNK